MYEAEFTILQEECTPLFWSKTIQEMELIRVRFENILSLEVEKEEKQLSKESLITKYRDVFEGIGKFEDFYHLEIESDSSMPVVKKPNGNLGICRYPKDLNKVLKLSHYPLPTIEDTLYQTYDAPAPSAPSTTEADFGTLSLTKRVLN